MAWMLDGKATIKEGGSRVPRAVGLLVQGRVWGPSCQPAAVPSTSLHSRTGLSPLVWTAAGEGPGVCLPCSTRPGFDYFTPGVCCSCGSRLLLFRGVAGAWGSSGSFRAFVTVESKSNQPMRLGS